MPQTKTIDVNSASQDELERTFQVGRERAEAIVANRPYRDWDDFKRKVPGFSHGMVENLRQAGVTIGSEGR